jgi:hypothetical protein
MNPLSRTSLVTVLLLTGIFAVACAPVKTVTPPTENAIPAGPDGAGEQPTARTREQVHAEAVEAAKHHRSTLSEELDYFKY